MCLTFVGINIASMLLPAIPPRVNRASLGLILQQPNVVYLSDFCPLHSTSYVVRTLR